MRLHRFIHDCDLSKEEIEILNKSLINQVKNVFRLKSGEKIILSDGMGNEGETVINSITKDRLVVSILKRNRETHSDKNVHLYLSILKKENFELAVQKSVEAGVSQITPIISERTVKTGLNKNRLEKIISEASEQCGRSRMPLLNSPISFDDAFKIANSDEKIIFHLGYPEYAPAKEAKSSSIFIGPEGGFSEKEILLAENSDFKIFSLGPLTLRAETAAIIATYRAVHGV